MAALGWGIGELEQNVERKNRETQGTAAVLSWPYTQPPV